MTSIGSSNIGDFYLVQLMCNYYTLRQDGSRAYIRFWNLQVNVYLLACINIYFFGKIMIWFINSILFKKKSLVYEE